MAAYDVVALGELLIDFTENGMSAQGNPVLEANPGGAPCNVLSMLKRLGHSAAFIGKVGKDQFGSQLKEALVEVGIATEGLMIDDKVNTTLAFVHTLPGGDRQFSFYRNPGADMMLSEEDLKEDMIKECKIFHFGTLSMTHEGCKAATKKAVALAREAGKVISFDPNLRFNLWDDMEALRSAVLWGMGQCDILKISDNEIQWMSGLEDFDAGVNWIRERFPEISLILVSLGPDGSMGFSGDKRAFVPAFINPNTIETTGAGDTFCASVLHYVLENGLKTYTEDELTDMIRFANAAASIVTTRKGALRVMPTREEVLQALK